MNDLRTFPLQPPVHTHDLIDGVFTSVLGTRVDGTERRTAPRLSLSCSSDTGTAGRSFSS